jgi:hypothetical protein
VLKQVSSDKTHARSVDVDINLQPLYLKPRELKSEKVNDLIKLLLLVPSEYHQFYNSLKSDDDSYAVVLHHPDLEYDSNQDD